MYFIYSITLHKEHDFIVNYIGGDYPNDNVRQSQITINGVDWEDWYNGLNSVAFDSFEEMVNNETGIYMYMRKYLVYLDEQEQELYESDYNGDWIECPYDALRDSQQDGYN